ncbi:MAG: dihydrodipicolinate synthase family protein [Anaerolineales bacterium]
MANQTISIAGIHPPVATPFTTDGDFDPAAFRRNFARWNEQPLAGYVVLGSNGEFPLLSADERVEVVQAARAVIPSDRLLIAGSGMESTRATIHMTERMAAAGADVAIVVTPNYYKAKMTGDALEAHYRAVAEAAPVPVLIYNVPVYTAVDMPADAIIRASHHPNIIGMKESGPQMGKIGRIIREAAPGFQVLTGSASGFLAALAMGAVGGVMALANFAAAELVAVMALLRDGDLAGARAIQQRLIEPNFAVTAKFGIAGLKSALDLLGYRGGPVRSPLQPLTAAEVGELRAILARAEFLD